MGLLSKRLKELRLSKGYSLQELADRSNTSKSAINMYERGERHPKHDVLVSLANVLDVDIDYLLGKTDNRRRHSMRISTKVNSSIAHNIQIHREKAGLSKKQFSDLLEVAEEDVEALESGLCDIDKEMLYKISNVLCITPGTLLPRDAEELDEDLEYFLLRRKHNPVRLQIESYLDTLAPESLAAELDRYRALDGLSDTLPAGKRRLPLLGNVACGEPIYAAEEHEAYAVADADIGADFCLIARGDSMINARIFDGDVLFVRLQESVDDGEIAVVLINDEATVKRVYYDKENNVVTLIPENPLYKPMRYVGEQLCDIRILGKVVAGQYTI